MNNKTEVNIACNLAARLSAYTFGNSLSVDVAYIVLCIINVLIWLVATLGNLIVAMALWKIRRAQEPSTFLLGYLCVTDLLHTLTSQPMFIAAFFVILSKRTESYCFMNTISGLSACIFTGTSFLIVTAIAVDKYIALKLHLRYNEYVTGKRTVFVLLGSFLFATALAVTWIIGLGKTFDILLVVLLATGILITTFASGMVHKIVKKHQRCIRTQEQSIAPYCLNLKKHERSANTTLYIMAAFIVCFSPYFAVILILKKTSFEVQHSRGIIFMVCRTLLNANSSINPFLYCFRLRRVRQIVLGVLNNRSKVTCRFI